MAAVIESVEVEVPIRTAYDQWTQFESFPHFMDGVENVAQVSDTMTHWRITIGGVAREFDAVITQQHPDQMVAWKSVSGPTHAGQVTFEKIDADHTRVTAQMQTDPEGLVENLADKLGILSRRTKADLQRFKEFIEGRDTATGAWRGDIPGELPGGNADPGVG